MDSSSKSSSALQTKKFLEDLFGSILKNSISVIKKDLESSLSFYNSKMLSQSDEKITLNFLINDFKDGNGRNILHFASSRGEIPIFDYILSKGGNLSIQDSEGNTPLFIATQHHNNELVKHIIEKLDYGVKKTRNGGVSVLHLAGSLGYNDLVDYFIEKGCDIEGISELGTPIDWATMFNQLDVVKNLIAKGAHIRNENINNEKEILPATIILAINSGHNEIAKFLIRHQFSCIFHKDPHGWTTLHVACEVGNEDIVKFIINEIKEKKGNDDLIKFCNEMVNETTAMDLAFLKEKWNCLSILKQFSSKYNNFEKSEIKLGEPKIQNKELALEKKNQGNSYFEKQEYKEALKLYTEAIELDENNAVIYTNRSACYIKMGLLENGLKDSQKAKLLDPKWIKAYFREGESYLLMKEYGDAAASFWEGLQIEPSNKVFKQAFDQAVKVGKEYNKTKNNN